MRGRGVAGGLESARAGERGQFSRLVLLELDAGAREEINRILRVDVVPARGVIEVRGVGGWSSQRWTSHPIENLKLNWYVQMPGASSPSSLHSVMPSWMILSRSTLQRTCRESQRVSLGGAP